MGWLENRYKTYMPKLRGLPLLMEKIVPTNPPLFFHWERYAAQNASLVSVSAYVFYIHPILFAKISVFLNPLK